MNSSPRVAIIDYKMSNLFSIKNALDSLDIESFITSSPEEISNSDGAILPGVGSYPVAMNNLKELNLISSIKEFVESGKPFMGICLGLQLLFESSEEFGSTKGIGLIKGSVNLFSKINEIKTIPHVGWNTVITEKFNQNNLDQPELLSSEDYFYFVHSLYVEPSEAEVIKTYTYHDGFKFCSSIMHQNIFASQFHPEKSGKVGLKILKNFFII